MFVLCVVCYFCSCTLYIHAAYSVHVLHLSSLALLHANFHEVKTKTSGCFSMSKESSLPWGESCHKSMYRLKNIFKIFPLLPVQLQKKIHNPSRPKISHISGHRLSSKSVRYRTFIYFFGSLVFFCQRDTCTCISRDQISHIQSMVAMRGLTNRANVHTPVWKSRLKHSTAEIQAIQ